MRRRVTVHPVAAQGFGSTVDAYRRSRPSYPAEAVAWLVEALAIGPGRVVVDVGAGTGLFTRLLAHTGATLLAVEPIDAMRAALVESLPGVTAVAGTAESLPLPDASADAIVAAQAFHWFDRARALPEFARVLRPGGRLGVIWNDIDTTVDWAAQFYAIVSPGRVSTPVPWSAAEGDLGPWFEGRHSSSFMHTHTHDRGSLLARVESMSWVAVLPSAERAEIIERVDRLLDVHPDLAERQAFELPYVTTAFWAEWL